MSQKIKNNKQIDGLMHVQTENVCMTLWIQAMLYVLLFISLLADIVEANGQIKVPYLTVGEYMLIRDLLFEYFWSHFLKGTAHIMFKTKLWLKQTYLDQHVPENLCYSYLASNHTWTKNVIGNTVVILNAGQTSWSIHCRAVFSGSTVCCSITTLKIPQQKSNSPFQI